MKKTVTTGGFTLSSMVFIVFLIFKLAEIGKIATWSWWWVTSPLWMPIAIIPAIIIIVIIVCIIREILKMRR
jgi:hypothetical protein